MIHAVRRAVCGGVLLALAGSTASCTQQTHVLAGPAIAYPAGKPSYGGVATVGRGTGASIAKDESFHTFGLAARALITPEVQQLRAGPAFQLGEWSAQSRILLEGAVPLALGVERFDGRFGASIGSGLALRIGYPLTDHTTYLVPWFRPGPDLPNEQKRRRRERTVLAIGPSADIDFRLTHQPLPTLSLLIGVLWLSESLSPIEPVKPQMWAPLGTH